LIRVKAEKRLKGFNLAVEFNSKGKTTALFAPSGSGKSLTLRAIAGLLKPDSGTIEVNGKLFFDSERKINLPPQKRRVGFLFQDYALFPHMRVYENVAYGAKEKRLVEELLNLFQIEEIRNRYPDQISGGRSRG